LRKYLLAAVAIALSAVAVPSAGGPPQGPTPAAQAPVPWTFSGETGLVFVAVKPDATTAFEAGLASLGDVLAASQKPVRQKQKAGWRVFRQVEPYRGGLALYVFVLEPAMRDADYSVSAILAEGLPDDRTVRPAYVASLAGQQSRLDCSVALRFGPDLPPDAQADAPQEPAASADAPVPPKNSRTLSGDLGLVVMTIKPDKVPDFEASLVKLKAALAASTDRVRQRQAATWRVLKPAKPDPDQPVTMVFLMDPPVPGADYTVSKILGETFPGETRELFKSYSAAFSGGVNLLSYSLVRDFRQ
jgi:hypothetical protein